MLTLGRGTKVKVLFLVLVSVFNFNLFKFSAAILEKGLLAEKNSHHFVVQSEITREQKLLAETIFPACRLRIFG